MFAELGYGAAGVRDIVRRTDLAAGTFYNYFPDKEAVFRASCEEVGAGGAAPRARRPAVAAHTPREFVEDALPRVLRLHRRGRRRAPPSCRRNVAARSARCSRSPRRRPASASWPRTCAPRSPGEMPAVDVDYCAGAMVAVGLELGQRLVERDPPDVEGATRFATRAVPGRHRCVGPAAAVLLALAAPADGPAALRIGIAENTPNLFAVPLFQALGAKAITWFGATTPRFDAGLVAHGRPRPAYGEVRGGSPAARSTAPGSPSAPGSARSRACGPRRSRAGRPRRAGVPSSAAVIDVVEPRLRRVDPAAAVALGALAERAPVAGVGLVGDDLLGRDGEVERDRHALERVREQVVVAVGEDREAPAVPAQRAEGRADVVEDRQLVPVVDERGLGRPPAARCPRARRRGAASRSAPRGSWGAGRWASTSASRSW